MTLLELVFALALFAFVLLLVFWAFDYGTRSFHRANSQQGIQGDAVRAISSMHDDLRRTSGGSVSVEKRTASVDGSTVQRDGLCLAAVRDWGTDTTAEGMPDWNRYLVFYATQSVPAGQLVKVVVDPEATTGAPGPLDGFGPDLMNDSPRLNTFDGRPPPFTVLAENVLEFRTDRNPDGSVRIELKLKERGTANPTGAVRKDLTYEADVLVYPQNTYPPE